jgi:hypothetical protein
MSSRRSRSNTRLDARRFFPLPHRYAVKGALAICLTLACSGAVTLAPRIAHAKPPAAHAAKQPIGVGAITGPQGPKVRAKLLKILRDSGSYEVTDVEDVKPGAQPATYQSMATGIQADAIVVGTVSKAMTLTLSVYGANGVRVDAVQIKGGGSTPKLLKEMDNELEISLADPLARSRSNGKAAAAAPVAVAAGAPAASKATTTPDDEDEPEAKPAAKAAPAAKGKKGKGDELESVDIPATPEEAAAAEASTAASSDSTESSEASDHGLRPLEVSVGLRGYNRKYEYTGVPPGQNLAIPYSLSVAPTIFVAARVYPWAFGSNGLLSHLGVMGRFEYGIATSANYLTTTFQTHTNEYQLGIRGRLPIEHHELGMFALYGAQNFTFSDTNGTTASPIPNVHYHYLRFGVDARFYISKLVVGAHVAPRFLTSMSVLDSWFPGATGSGLDGGLMLGWQVLPWLTVTGGMDFVRYGFDFNNQPATPPPRIIAGGATDTYVSGWLAAMFNFDFASKGATAGAAASTEASDSSESTEKSEKSAKPEKSDDDEEPAKTPPPPKAKKAAAPPPPPPAAAPAKKKAAPQPEEDEEEE